MKWPATCGADEQKKRHREREETDRQSCVFPCVRACVCVEMKAQRQRPTYEYARERPSVRQSVSWSYTYTYTYYALSLNSVFHVRNVRQHGEFETRSTFQILEGSE